MIISQNEIYGGDNVREYLVKLRERRSLTQIEAAKRLLISQSYLSSLETGVRKRSLSLATLKAFAKLYGAPLELLITEEGRYNDAHQCTIKEVK